MPNHLHLLIYTPENSTSLNRIVGNGKRFLAYEIVKRLKQQSRYDLPDIASKRVVPGERKRGKLHEIFESSFDARIMYSMKMLQEKLHYIHVNPISKNWKLVEDYLDYKHSSARFYELNEA